MGILFDIQRCSYHDGPGIRTTVFFKGCQLRCAWCHNPESFALRPQLQYLSHRCVGCGKCAVLCPGKAHVFDMGMHHVNFSACTACGKCAAACPQNAVKLIGYEASAAQIMDIVRKDRAYYETSGGGLTISGGEPTLQPDFLAELLSLAKREGIHTCMETNGYISPAVLAELLPLLDLVLLDYKITDPDSLRRHTLAFGPLWEETIASLNAAGTPVILRMPIIPGINDTMEHMAQAASLSRAYPNIQKIEIMPYHNTGACKWEQLGLSYSLAALPSATSEQKSLWQSMLQDCQKEADPI